jgi:hypothetical protein
MRRPWFVELMLVLAVHDLIVKRASFLGATGRHLGCDLQPRVRN